MTSMVLRNSTLESLTPSANAILVCHVVEGRVPRLLGEAQQAAMAIVTSALMSVSPKLYFREYSHWVFFVPHTKKTLCRDIDEEAGHLVTLLEEFYFILCWRKITRRRH